MCATVKNRKNAGMPKKLTLSRKTDIQITDFQMKLSHLITFGGLPGLANYRDVTIDQELSYNYPGCSLHLAFLSRIVLSFTK